MLAVAAALNTNVVALVMDATVAPSGIPAPVTVIPTTSWAVESMLTVVLLLMSQVASTIG